MVVGKKAAHTYTALGIFHDLFTMKVLFSALTRSGGIGFLSTGQLLVSLKLERKKDSLENTTALQTLERTGELRVVQRLAAEKWWEL